MKMRWIIGVAACAAAFGAQAQYKYIGPDGKVVYSDQPPPANAKVLEKKGPPPQSTGGPELPFAVKNAMKTYPVTLYTAGNCGSACSEGRNYLVKRGVPFAEKTVNTSDDAVKFKKDLGTDQLPVLTVGGTKQIQWQQDGWAGALTSAGYPLESQLPPGYKNTAPVAIAPPAAAPANQTASTQGSPPPPPADTGSSPAAPSGDRPAWFKGF
ncbi:MAG TPA: glutaredoxin family protein [Burkholderiales bacterium]|nr:glutaredoxin family protein [Burkholderiales bacterium]